MEEHLKALFQLEVILSNIAYSNFLLNGAKPATAFTMADLGMISLAFAFAIAAMVYTIGHISGCHIIVLVLLIRSVDVRTSIRFGRCMDDH